MAVLLTAMVTLIVASLTGLIFFLVSRVFDSLNPAIESDLAWKARRGAIELSKTAELGVLIHDSATVAHAARDYIASPETVNVVAVDANGGIVYQYGPSIPTTLTVLSRAAGAVHRMPGRLVAWAPVIIEGEEVGRVAVAISLSRLAAGQTLRRQITWIALCGALVATSLTLGFVALYIWPILRVTQTAFVRLEHTTHAALAAGRLKAQFLANMSHEIRTPINAVVGLSKLMLGLPLSAKMQRYAEMIDASARALLTIINDILDFSKIEAGKYEIHPVPCELALVVQEVVELLAEKAQSKGLDFIYRITPDVPRIIEADADRVRQVLTNLVGNAVKFTDRGEVYVLVSSRTLGEQAVELKFEVRDTGMGVSEDMRERIFESFSQADGSLVRKHGGTGLGLAISKQLVQLMGGAISVESELGHGSCFSFTLPARVLDASSAARGHPSIVGKRALIACHNDHSSQALAEHVVAWGMSARVVKTSPEAADELQTAVASGCDFVIVAESQSGMPGSDVVAAVRRTEAASGLPIVLLSQLRADSTNKQQHGVSVQLNQPVRMSELYENVSRLLLPGDQRPAKDHSHAFVRSFVGSQILVVDDNELNQFVALEQLQRFGCQVDQAFNGREAIEAVFKHAYSLVLMDCQMPVMDGYAATREIRAREAGGQHLVIIALTAHALEGERARVLSAGMDDYLTKPLLPHVLQRKLAQWIGSSASTEEAQTQSALESRASTEPAGQERDFDDCATNLLQLFLEKVPAQLELLDGALAVGDHTEARAQAHKLKGSLFAVSATELAGLAEDMQHAAERADLSLSEAQLGELVAGYYTLEAGIKRELARRAHATREAVHG